MDNAALAIIGSECKSACSGEPDLERRVRKAMAVVADGHWMYAGDHQEDLRFRGALAGVMTAPETTEEEKKRITDTLASLRAFNAMLIGINVDFDAIAERLESNPPLPLMKWWNEARTKRAA
ncbi:MAG: hypothetical protein P4L85_14285 [Paludisphaera borealis]|uniref:hypothetical protein n=1 Tax=Paludisphaera borealis TaxID=1387353 RepID=UPI0028430CD6|nr:hypothetical protein [Paludisphaera borealis]MDR3620515.1 hypothetical protein [Paludisphaera borealis]